jgi:hypothetical protein
MGETPVDISYKEDGCSDEHVQHKDVMGLPDVHEKEDEEIEQYCHADGKAFFKAQKFFRITCLHRRTPCAVFFIGDL